MAPQVLMCENYNESVDIWSSGVMLYEMLCGIKPFNAQREDLLKQQIIKGEFSFNHSRFQNVSFFFVK